MAETRRGCGDDGDGGVHSPESMLWSALVAVICGAEAALATDASNVPPTKIAAAMTVTVLADISVLHLHFS